MSGFVPDPDRNKLETVFVTMRELQVKPGQGLGGFEVGMNINEALSYLRTLFEPCRPFIDVMYSSAFPLAKSILLRVPDVGLQLHFDPKSQRLKVIEVSNFGTIPLSYSETVFTGHKNRQKPETQFLKIYKLFGPTYPGQFDTQLDLYVLKYRGLCFMFPIPPMYREKYKGNDLPLELPDGNSPMAHRMYIFGGFDLKDPVLPKPSPETIVEVGILLGSHSETQNSNKSILTASTLMLNNHNKHCLRIGSSVEDALSELGPPSAVHFKEDDKMRIHSLGNSKDDIGANIDRNTVNSMKNHLDFPIQTHEGSNQDEVVTESSRGGKPKADVYKSMTAQCFKSSDYFFNYFEHGIDLLFDCKLHTVKKIILHSNFPGHPEFSIYKKCQFRIVGVTTPRGKSMKELNDEYDIDITSDSNWEQVESIMGSGGKPMIHDSGAVANPFGATYLYAYEGCIFEIMKSGAIASLTLF